MEEWADGSEWATDWTYGVEASEEQEDPEYAAYPANAGAGGPWAGQHPVMTKIPPSYNGTASWFAFAIMKKLWQIGWTLQSWKKLDAVLLLKLALRERHICICVSRSP
eukprot:3473531-Amphidinium_carterae.1